MQYGRQHLWKVNVVDQRENAGDPAMSVEILNLLLQAENMRNLELLHLICNLEVALLPLIIKMLFLQHALGLTGTVRGQGWIYQCWSAPEHYSEKQM